MKTTFGENPSLVLYKKHKENIDISRNRLLTNLNKIHPKIRLQVENLYDLRKKNLSLPYLGELYPWVVSEVFGLDNYNQIHDVSQNWLALYYYTIFVDDVIDSDLNSFEGEEMISLTALLKEGLLKLYKTVADTKFEKEFDKTLNVVLSQGKIEQEESHFVSDNQDVKITYSARKNDLLKLCAYALVSRCNTNAEKSRLILDFTNRLQLCFQYLDDIADLKEDFRDKNYTVILNELFKEIDISSVNENNLTVSLIQSQVLKRFTEQIKILLSEVSLSIPNKSSVSSNYFYILLKNVTELDTFLLQINYSFFNEPEADSYRRKIITEVEKKLQIVAASS